uniref:Uncharacterized protein n=1 Tax=Arundo donax TaxID=35708 RepID=A0A0A9HLZ8_ARUDO
MKSVRRVIMISAMYKGREKLSPIDSYHSWKIMVILHFLH